MLHVVMYYTPAADHAAASCLSTVYVNYVVVRNHVIHGTLDLKSSG